MASQNVKRRFVPGLEQLDDRWLPSAVTFEPLAVAPTDDPLLTTAGVDYALPPDPAPPGDQSRTPALTPTDPPATDPPLTDPVLTTFVEPPAPAPSPGPLPGP